MVKRANIIILFGVAVLLSDVCLATLDWMIARDALISAVADRADIARRTFAETVLRGERTLTETITGLPAIGSVLGKATDLLATSRARQDVAEPAELAALRQSLSDTLTTRHHPDPPAPQSGLTFYLGSDLTVFLRTDQPSIYGDRAPSGDTPASRAAQTRGIVTGLAVTPQGAALATALPIATDSFVGVVEAEIPFEGLPPFCSTQPCGTAVLLAPDRVVMPLNQATRNVVLAPDHRIGRYFLGAAVDPVLTRAIVDALPPGDANATRWALVEAGQTWLVATQFPLSLQPADGVPEGRNAGVVVAWTNADDLVHRFRRRQWTLVGGCSFAFLFVFALGFGLLSVSTRDLEREIVGRDAEIKLLLTKVSHLSSRDPLTDLLNHQAFSDHLDAEIARAQRSGSGFSYISFDFDHFRTFNKTFGPEMGDTVLRLAAATIIETLRAEDIAGRVGGDAFALVLPNTGLDGALALAERLRLSIASRQRDAKPADPADAAPPLVTVSAGVTRWRPGLRRGEVLSNADIALHRAKTGGRDRIAVVPETDD